jgi:hypothetical protein
MGSGNNRYFDRSVTCHVFRIETQGCAAQTIEVQVTKIELSIIRVRLRESV